MASWKGVVNGVSRIIVEMLSFTSRDMSCERLLARRMSFFWMGVESIGVLLKLVISLGGGLPDFEEISFISHFFLQSYEIF